MRAEQGAAQAYLAQEFQIFLFFVFALLLTQLLSFGIVHLLESVGRKSVMRLI
jgi:uncharacterized protein YhhL (DUF1145 family)